MRVTLAASMTAALVLFACGGCSSTKMPSLPTFGFKGKGNTSSEANLTNAPPAPQFNSMAGGPPSAAVPQQAWSNLPVYPGTNYPQTPYPQQAATPGGTAPPYAANPAAGYAANYGAMPASAAGTPVSPGSPYAPYPSASGQAPSYVQQQASPYGQQPYAQQPPSGAATQPYNTATPYNTYTR